MHKLHNSLFIQYSRKLIHIHETLTNFNPTTSQITYNMFIDNTTDILEQLQYKPSTLECVRIVIIINLT